jgi:hypothetical protein
MSVYKCVLQAFVFCFLAPFVYYCVLSCGLNAILTHLNKTGIAVRITTHCRLNGPGSNPGWGEMFPNRPAWLWDPQPPEKWVPRPFPGGKRPLTPSSIEVKERVKLYIYSPL